MVGYDDETVEPTFKISSYEFHVNSTDHYFISADAITSGLISQLGTAKDPTTILIGATDVTSWTAIDNSTKTATGAWTYDASNGYFKFTANYTSETDKTNVGHTAYFTKQEESIVYCTVTTDAESKEVWTPIENPTDDQKTNFITTVKTYIWSSSSSAYAVVATKKTKGDTADEWVIGFETVTTTDSSQDPPTSTTSFKTYSPAEAYLIFQ